MVSRKEKERMVGFIVGRLEDSGLYKILNKGTDQILTLEKQGVREQPRRIFVMTHNHKRTLPQLRQEQEENRQQGIYTAHVFFKDGEISFVRLAENEAWRTDQSLKNYTPQQINQMLHLRGLEKAVLQGQGSDLVYYQPETERLEESLRMFHLSEVRFDYSHLRPGDAGYGFARNRTSVDYRLAEDKKLEYRAAKFKFLKDQPDGLYRTWLYPAEKREIGTPKQARQTSLF